jgi:hypothetical protein
MIINGCLVALMGMLYTIMGPAMFAMMEMDKQNVRQDDKIVLGVMSGVYLGCGAVLLAIGVMHVISGIMALRYKGRVFAIVTLFTNIITLLTCYCAITGIAVLIFGLIVFFNSEVTETFRLVAKGMSVDDAVEAAEGGRRRPHFDDYDDRESPRTDRWGEPIDDAPPDDRIRPA